MQNRLFVRDFGSDMDATTLEDIFASVGTVKKVVLKTIHSGSGTPRLVSYIDMSSAQEVQDCIVRFHGTTTYGHTLTVTEDKPHVPDPNFQARRRAALKAKKK